MVYTFLELLPVRFVERLCRLRLHHCRPPARVRRLRWQTPSLAVNTLADGKMVSSRCTSFSKDVTRSALSQGGGLTVLEKTYSGGHCPFLFVQLCLPCAVTRHICMSPYSLHLSGGPGCDQPGGKQPSPISHIGAQSVVEPPAEMRLQTLMTILPHLLQGSMYGNRNCMCGKRRDRKCQCDSWKVEEHLERRGGCE